jgi:HK97 family phage major capsid protein
MSLQEMRQRRAQLIAEARGLLDRAANGVMSAEDQAQYDRLFEEANKLADTIKRAEQQAEAERALGEAATEAVRPGAQAGQREQRGGRSVPEFASRTLRGLNEVDAQWQQAPEWRGLLATTTPEYRRGFRAMLLGEQRAMQVDQDDLGGFLVTPLQLVDQLLAAIDDQVWMRQVATVIAVPSADSLGVPTLDTDPADADWTSELGTGNEDSSMRVGLRALHPQPLAKRLKISRTLVRKAPNSESMIMRRLAYKFGISQEKGFLVGTGAGQPLGVFTASPAGISTGRDVSTDNTATAITMKGLINAKYALKAAYWPNARWLFHRDAVKQIAGLRDDSGGAGTGQFLWYPSVREGEPDMLLGRPMMVSEYAPNTFTTGLYVGIFGDFSNYWIADSLQMDMQRLVELYAATNQIGLIGRMESDGMPVLEEAFVRVKLA